MRAEQTKAVLGYLQDRAGRTRKASRVLALVTAMALLDQIPVQAAPPHWEQPRSQDVTGVAAPDARATNSNRWSAESRTIRGPRTVSWPKPMEASVDLRVAASGSPAAQAATGTGPARVADSPIWVGQGFGRDVLTSKTLASGVEKARIKIFDQPAAQRAGVDGLLIGVGRADGVNRAGYVDMRVDYSGFANAYGGDWASRLRIRKYPACLLTTPDVPQCQRGEDLSTGNDVRVSTLTATAPVTADGMSVLAVQAASSGGNGSYSATSLSQAGTWSVSPQTGDFSWSYPLRMPPAPGGPAPNIGFGYSAGSIDGRTSTSNNQGGWVGDGWDAWSGFIERKYASCSDDNPSHKTGDQCWHSSNATLSLSGHAGELLETGTANEWRLKNDDGTRVQRLTGSARGNGDNDNEYWKVTTTDGMQFFFGYHKLPNWSTGKAVTNSVWTVPVYGNNTGEPCYDSTFANASCDQAWRWNLDYVIDPHSNTMAYFYNTESGWYGRDNDPSKRTPYVRAGWLDRIEYGMRQNSEYSSSAPLKVSFATAERCLSGCWTGAAWTSTPVATAWPDSPLDQACAQAPCTDNTSPTFWSMRRLTKITTQIRSSASAYRDVESWTLRHEFLNAGDNEGSPLWLRGITRTGHVTTAGGAETSDPEITFDPGADPLANRVDGPSDGRTSLTRYRIKTVFNESGGQINITYSAPECTKSTLPTPATNTKRCFPSFYAPAGEPSLDWFHKYVVTEVNLLDRTAEGTSAAGNAIHTTYYDYLDAPAWHYTDDEITPSKYKTWGDWRGYGRVRVRTGATSGQQTATETRFLRGMDGDKQTSGVRDIHITDSWGGTVEDHEALNGFVLQTIKYNGPGGAEISSGVNSPQVIGPKATRNVSGVTTQAWTVKTNVARSRQPLATGGWRITKTKTTFNTDGFATSSETDADEAAPGDETCTRTLYARNNNTWMIDKISQVEQLSGLCPEGDPASASVLSRSRMFYDVYTGESSFGAAPTIGDVVRTEALGDWNGSTPVYVPTASTKYDTAGRITESINALGHTSITGYTIDTNTGLVTGTTVTNALDHVSSMTSEPAWQQPIHTVDANGVVTELTYDGLGRLTQAWLPGRSKASQTPSIKYGYTMRATGGPSAVTQEMLLHTGSGYRKTATLYDGFLRMRQTQTQATGGGRLISDTLHNTHGLADWVSLPYWDKTGAAVSTSLAAPGGTVPAVMQRLYDGAGRQTAEVFLDSGTEKYRSTNLYQGERSTAIPPTGGTPSMVIADSQGRAQQMRQYKRVQDIGSDDPATFDATNYEYDLNGKLIKLTDAAKNQWTFQHDLRGRQIRSTDPDRGTTTTTFDDEGQVETVTSPLGSGSTATLAFTYDKLGRKTSTRDNTIGGPIRASWIYDQTLIMPAGTSKAKGKLTSSTRKVGGNDYTSKVDSYDVFGRELSTSVILPTSESDLCAAAAPNTCTYTTTTTYRPNGSVNTTTLPAVADLGAETLTYGYSDVGDPGSLYTGTQTYVGTVKYSKTGQLTERYLGASGKRVMMIYNFDEPSRRLKTLRVVPESKPDAASYAYTYDDNGSIKKITDLVGTSSTDQQCFEYDYLHRLTEAWTPTSGDCGATRSLNALGGPAPYWHSWTFDGAGNRETETRHAATNTTYTYGYSNSGTASVRPHAATRIIASGGQTWTRNYTYDDAGNALSRPNSSGTAQQLAFDAEGHLSSLTDSSQSTSYVYGTDGSRLIRKDPNGSKTLYLSGGDEVRFDKTAGTKKGTRYYSHAGTPVAIRTASSLCWITGDHHNTAELTIDASTLAVAKRRTHPYGEERPNSTGTWASGMDKGFVGGTKDPSGLTHIGAREYDPFTGRFQSPDPLQSTDTPQSFSPYHYSQNDPVNKTDPSGLKETKGDEDGGGSFKQPSLFSDFDGCDIAKRGCDKVSKPDPRIVVKIKKLTNGTTVTYHADGGVKINGYKLPPGYSNVDALAGFLDANFRKDRFNSEKKLERLGNTMSLIQKACAAGAGCSEKFKMGVFADVSALTELASANKGDTTSDEIAEAGGVRGYLENWAARLKADIAAAGKDRFITVAVGIGHKDGKIVVMVGASGDTKISDVRKLGIALPAGAVDVEGKLHAEVNIGEYAKRNGIQDIAIGASKPACPMCSLYTRVFRMKMVTKASGFITPSGATSWAMDIGSWQGGE